jgi:hypothetical protein
VQPQGETLAGEELWVAQLLSGGGDPAPQLEHAEGQPVIDSFRVLEVFLRRETVGEGVALTRALLLGERHGLRADVVLATGGEPLSKDQRQNLIRSCLEHRASGVIIARSEDHADRSEVDRASEASAVARSLEMLGMRLVDYVLVGVSEIRRV